MSRAEQEEVLEIFTKIREETGWQVAFLNTELKRKWGWEEENDQSKRPPAGGQPQSSIMMQQPQQLHQSHHQHMPSNGSTSSLSSYGFPGQSTTQPQQQPSNSMGPAPSMMGKTKQGIVNPILRMADFSAPVHPYQNYYVPPIQPLVHF